jgi:hypothetical protein
MRLTAPQIDRGVATIRTTARLVSPNADIELWYEAPVDWPIDRTCAPFVPVATLLATAAGDDELVVDGSIPTPLLDGAHRASELIGIHFGHRGVAIEAEGRPPPVVDEIDRRVGLFLSRGVDSSANLVLGDQGRLDPRPDTAIIVSGIDPANSADLEARLCAGAVDAAAAFGLGSVVVASNMRSVIDHRMLWIEGFGEVLAGVGLLLSDRVSDAIISSAAPHQRFYTGSHPDIDPLWGNGVVAFHHLPTDLERSEKVKLIVEDGRPLEFLRVCWAGQDHNCGRCRKCMQTLTLIEAFGGDPSGLFDDTDVSPEDLRRDGPGYILRPDYVHAAPADLAPAAAERLDAAETRAAPGALLEAAAAGPNGAESWLVLSSNGPEAATLLATALRHGRGTVLDGGPTLTTHVLRTAAGHAGVTMWPTIDATTDGLRAIACLQSGSRPLIVHPEGARDAARAALPGSVQDLVGSVADVGVAIDRAADDLPRLAAALTGGALGWLQAGR